MKKLWVDDERPAPDAGWDVAMSADDARAMLQETAYDIVSLDYVLIGWDSGFDVLLWMQKQAVWPRELHSHSGGSTGRYQILSHAKEVGPEGLILVDDSNQDGK